jgi:hypothetical protein
MILVVWGVFGDGGVRAGTISGTWSGNISYSVQQYSAAVQTDSFTGVVNGTMTLS